MEGDFLCLPAGRQGYKFLKIYEKAK